MSELTDNQEPWPVRPGSLAERVGAYIERFCLLRPPPPPPLYVGFSGGADSLALVLLLRHLQWPVHAVHFHHNIRGAAADLDADWCASFCQRHGIPFSLFRFDTPACRGRGESMEAAARRLRLQRWQELTRQGQTVALGHHADDALENMLLRLARGSNVGGLTGLRAVSVVAGVRLVRPLLLIRRCELESYLDRQGLSDWREDRSNQENRIRRNAVRNQWLPVIRATLAGDQGLIRSLDNLREDADYLEREAVKEMKKNPQPRLSRLARLHPAILPRVLRLYLGEALGRDFVPRRQAIERLRGFLAAPSGAGRILPVGEGVELYLHHDRMRVMELHSGWPEQGWRWQEQSRLSLGDGQWILESRVVAIDDVQNLGDRQARTVYFPVSRLPSVLLVRRRRPGDRMTPFGRHQSVKLKDVFNRTGVPAAWRDTIPLVTAAREVIWVPLVKRAAYGRVDIGQTGTLLACLSCRQSPLE